MKKNITITTNETLADINRENEISIYKIIPVEVKGIELLGLRYAYRIIYTLAEELVSAFLGSEYPMDRKHLAKGGFEFIREGIGQMEGCGTGCMYKMTDDDSITLFVRWEKMPFEKLAEV